jgi:hypothetical protein
MPLKVLRESGVGLVNLNPIALKSVGFIGIKEGGKFQPRATAFFVRYSDHGHVFDHMVTAEHVISGLLTSGREIWLRINTKDGKAIEAKCDPRAFRFHPNNEHDPTDVAVAPFNPSLVDDESGERFEADVGSMILNGLEEGFLPTEEFARQSIGLGAEIAIVGLFRSHFGKNRNVPIVRVGNISALRGEPIWTEYAGYIDAYLVEARSIAGLSGSPVVVLPDPALTLARGLARKPPGQALALLGLMHGHFDVRNLNEDVVRERDAPERSVHTGIGVVVPVEKIVETINHPDLVAMRREIIEQTSKSAGTPAGAVPEPQNSPVALTNGESPRSDSET